MEKEGLLAVAVGKVDGVDGEKFRQVFAGGSGLDQSAVAGADEGRGPAEAGGMAARGLQQMGFAALGRPPDEGLERGVVRCPAFGEPFQQLADQAAVGAGESGKGGAWVQAQRQGLLPPAELRRSAAGSLFLSAVAAAEFGAVVAVAKRSGVGGGMDLAGGPDQLGSFDFQGAVE